MRNAQDDSTAYDTPRKNFTFYAVDTGGTIGETTIPALERFDGSAADPALAVQFIPTDAVSRDLFGGGTVAASPDVLQVVTETEADAIQALADTAGIDDVFPYGFVVRNPNSPTSRTLPPSPAVGQFDGIVTFAFKVPLQADPADDPFTVSALFLAVDDDEVKLTQSLEEQTPAGRLAFDARADALGADVLTLLPPGGGTVWTDRAVRVLCDVRVAGATGPGATTISPTVATEPWLVIAPLGPRSYTLPRTVRPAVASCSGIASADSSSFAVHGFQSGRVRGAYDGVGGTFVRAPAARGGNFFPGEEVEVTLTTGLGGTKPVVARYRAAAGAAPRSFLADTAYDVGNGPASAALGDLDGDGDLDMAVANASYSFSVSVVLNQGGGRFGAQAGYPVGSQQRSVTPGDLDGDGDLDLATPLTAGSEDVSVLLNHGNGSFGPRATYSAGGFPGSIALGDVDGDRDLDLVTVHNYRETVWVLLNQ